MGQVPELGEGPGRGLLGLGEQFRCFLRRFPDGLADQPEVDTERDELLLGAVVQVSLQPAASLIGRGDEAMPGGSHVLDQRHVAEHQARLARHGLDEALGGRGERFARRGHHAQRAEPLTLVHNLEDTAALDGLIVSHRCRIAGGRLAVR